MIPSFRNPFKVEEDIKESSNQSSVIVGLKILVQISQGKSNIVVNKSAVPKGCKPSSDEFSCFLKSCHLCNKKLSLDKEVYMRGDQGFCSIKCRDRQMYLDDIKDLENSTKQMLSSARRHCSGGGDDRRETQLLLKELRKRRHNNQPHSQKIQWTIVS